MDNINVERKTSEWSRTRRRKKAWQRVLAGMMAVVVFSTTYALILPAITKEQEVFCGHAEHEHGEACYERVLICGYPADEQGASLLFGGTHAAEALEGEATDAGAEDAQRAVEDAGPYEGDVTPAPAGEGAGDPTDLVAPVISDASPTEWVAEEEEEGGSGGEAFVNGEAGDGSGAERASSDDVEGSRPAAQEATTPAPDRHVHTDECYELQLKCGLEAHAHGLACFSNPEADLESEESWTRSVAAVELSGDWAADLVAIAESQLGNGESTNNYAVNENGEKQGYTRYGAWWAPANAYDPWCAMFVSFCLDFAGVDKELFPQYAGCAQWQGELEARGLWREAAFYTPAPGDVIFFDYDFDALSDHVGIVASADAESVTTIEGNNSTKVEQFTYEPKDERILGYGVLPVNPAAEGDVTPAPAGEDAQRAVEDAGPYEDAAARNEEILKLSTEAAGVKITLTGPKSSLPWPLEELELWASPVTDPAAVALIEEGLETPAGMTRRTLLFDIRIYHNGVEVQPEGDVLVRFGGVEVPNNDAQVFYVDPETETVEEETVKQGKETLSFETDHFSIRGITYTTQDIGDAYVPGAASVTALSLRTVTGTKDWDGDDNDGNDSGPDNDLVRSFDTIFYNVGYTLNLNERYAYLQQQGLFKGFTTARLYVRASLPLTEDKAIFDKSAMPWLHMEDEISDLTHQEIFGYYELTAGALDYIVPSAGTLRFAIFVKGMQDTDKDANSLVQPTLQVWLDAPGDDQFYNPTATETVTPAATRVSSATNYNIRLVPYSQAQINWNDSARKGAEGVLVPLCVSVSVLSPHGDTKGTYVPATIGSLSFRMQGAWNNDVHCDIQHDWRCFYDYSLVNGSATGVQGMPLPLPGEELGQVPFSSRSYPGANEGNAVFDSGTMSVQHILGDYGHFLITFSNIRTNWEFPSFTASGAPLLPGSGFLIATGVVPVYWCTGRLYDGMVSQTTQFPWWVAINTIVVDGVVTPDMNSSDNNHGGTVIVHPVGGYSDGFRVEAPRVLGLGYDYGSDVVPGSVFGLHCDGDATIPITSADNFVKFDPNVLEPLETSRLVFDDTAGITDKTIKKYYVCYADGGSYTNWSAMHVYSVFNQDRPMAFFDSLAAMKAWNPNALCVGFFYELRSPTGTQLGPSPMGRWGYRFHDLDCLRVRNDAVPGSYTILLRDSKVYEGNAPVSAVSGTTTFYDHTPMMGRINGLQTMCATKPNMTKAFYADPVWRGGTRGTVPAVTDYLGQYFAEGWRTGATLWINAEKPEINKQVVMLAYGLPRHSFFVSEGERLADFELTPRLIYSAGDGYVPQSSTVTVTETLDPGLRYVPGSAYVGGTYTQPSDRMSAGTHSGGTALVDNDTVTDVAVCDGVTDGTVKLDVSADGRTLTWTITGVVPGKEMPKLYYTAKIGDTNNPNNDVEDKDQLSTTTTITSANNVYQITAENGMVATATITVHKLDSSTLIKKVEQPVVGQDEVIRYRIEYTNDSPNPVGNVIIRDILPYDTDLTNDAPDGDPRGTKLHGSYVVNSVTVEKADGNVAGTWSVTTTTDTSVRNYHNDLFNVALKDLANAPFTANSSPTMLEITGEGVGAYAKITATIAIKPTGSQDADIFYNDAAVDAYVDTNRTQRAIPAPVYAAPVHAEVAVDTVELTVKKTVLVGDKTQKFPIRVSWTDGAATTTEELQLKDGETGTLTIPVGANVTITETEHPGYTVLIKEGSQTLARGDSYTIQSIAAARSIEVENTAGSPLPNSGGLGTALPVAFGVMTMAGALSVGLARRRRRSF